MVSEIPITPACFIPQTIFAINNQAILMGVLQKGELILSATTSINGKTYKLIDIQLLNKHVKSVKLENEKTQTIGIILSNMSIEDAQKTINQELIFK